MMTKEEAKLVLDNARPQTKEIDRQFYDDEDLNNALDLAIKALEQQPSEDCVSRADLLKIYENRFIELQKTHQTDKQLGINWCINTLNELPPVTPVTPTHGTCKDCKHYHNCNEICHILVMQTGDDFYCGYFEKVR